MLTDEQVIEQHDDGEMMRRPHLWPAHPFLPLTRPADGAEKDYGLLLDGSGATVFLTNLFFREMPVERINYGVRRGDPRGRMESGLMNERDSFDAFAEAIRAGIESEVAGIAPADDLEPKLIMEGADGLLHFAPLGHLFGSEEAKDYLGEVAMPSLIRATEASRAAWLTFAWFAKSLGEAESAAIEKWREEHGGSLEGGPGVIEGAQVWIGDFTGQFEMWTADVARDDEGRPSLGGWELAAPRVAWFGDSYSGRLVTPAMCALVGSPTPLEIRAAAKVMSQDDELRESFMEAFEELGLLSDGEPTDEQKKAFIRDPRFAELRELISEKSVELLGHPSPVTPRGGEASV